MSDPALRESLQRKMSTALESMKDEFERASDSIRQCVLGMESSDMRNVYEGIAPWGGVRMGSPCMRSVLNDAASTIEVALLAAMPWPKVGRSSRIPRKAASAWQRCYFILRCIRGLIRKGKREEAQRHVQDAAEAWERGKQLITLMLQQRTPLVPTEQRITWLTLDVDPERWGFELGFPLESIRAWMEARRRTPRAPGNALPESSIPAELPLLSGNFSKSQIESCMHLTKQMREYGLLASPQTHTWKVVLRLSGKVI